MPGIDQLTIDRGLAPHCFEPNAIEEGRQQWVPVKRLIQSGDRPRRALKSPRERWIDADPGTARWVVSPIEHGPPLGAASDVYRRRDPQAHCEPLGFNGLVVIRRQ